MLIDMGASAALTLFGRDVAIDCLVDEGRHSGSLLLNPILFVLGKKQVDANINIPLAPVASFLSDLRLRCFHLSSFTTSSFATAFDLLDRPRFC